MTKMEQITELLKTNLTDSFLQHALALENVKIGNDLVAKDLFENILLHQPTYIGSYYHLAKLYERLNETEKAINIYKNGMLQAKAVKDNHSYNELLAALEDLEDE